jgi:hypothetical protein
MAILEDPVRPFDPSARLDALDTDREADDRAATRGPQWKTSFELASRGGYIRTVTGTVAYLDAEAQTYMVLADGELLRVPLRDITSRHGERAIGEIDRSSDLDVEGLGTRQRGKPVLFEGTPAKV